MIDPRIERPTARDAIRHLAESRDLEEREAFRIAGAIMDGELTAAQIAGLLVAMKMKGETVAEIVGFTRAMRERARRVEVEADGLVDTCGTGGDASGTFNISTVAALVAAGAGVPVAKHGNRSVSSRCGSADLLEALGVRGDGGPEEARRSIRRHGIAFLFAPSYHGATRHAVAPRREIGLRSIFNIVGPLTNPAGARRQLMGVYDGALTEPLAQVLARLGSTHCLVVHGEDGLDEITLAGRTRVSELRDGRVDSYELDPAELGFAPRDPGDFLGGDPETNARIALEILEGRKGAPREIVLINAGAAIYVSGRASSIREGVESARHSIDSGDACARLAALRGSGR